MAYGKIDNELRDMMEVIIHYDYFYFILMLNKIIIFKLLCKFY